MSKLQLVEVYRIRMICGDCGCWAVFECPDREELQRHLVSIGWTATPDGKTAFCPDCSFMGWGRFN